MSRDDENTGPAVIVSLGVGALAGILGTWFLVQDVESDAPTMVEVIRSYTPEELQVACLPFMRQTATTLEEAQTRVSALEIRIRHKEAEIHRLEGEMLHSTEVEVEVGERLRAARTQLTSLEAQLADALEDKTQLLGDLQRTRAALAGTRLELAASEARVVEAREEALESQWRSFILGAQAEICESGSPAQLESCRQMVLARTSIHRRRYKDCVRSGQATPELRRASNRREEIPEAYAAWIDEDDRSTRSWYILFCDPDLPEAGGGGPKATVGELGPQDLD